VRGKLGRFSVSDGKEDLADIQSHADRQPSSVHASGEAQLERKGRFSVQEGPAAASSQQHAGGVPTASGTPTSPRSSAGMAQPTALPAMTATNAAAAAAVSQQQQAKAMATPASIALNNATNAGSGALAHQQSMQEHGNGAGGTGFKRRGSFDTSGAAGIASNLTNVATLIPHLQQLSTAVSEQQSHIVSLIGSLTGTAALGEAHVLPVVAAGRKVYATRMHAIPAPLYPPPTPCPSAIFASGIPRAWTTDPEADTYPNMCMHCFLCAFWSTLPLARRLTRWTACIPPRSWQAS